MKRRLIAAAAACLVIVVTPLAHAGASLALSDKAQLQAAMQSHIERASIDGRFLFFDTRTGSVAPLRQRSPHPEILRMGRYYILCSDFESQDGQAINVDFYVAQGASGYVVFDQQVENRAVVMGLMKAGKAERVE